MPSAPGQRDYSPGWIAKASVVAAAALYFVGLYLEGSRGADLAQGAFLQLLVPFVVVAPAWFVGLLAYSVPRRLAAARRQRVGDVAFAWVMVAVCVAWVVAAHAR